MEYRYAKCGLDNNSKDDSNIERLIFKHDCGEYDNQTIFCGNNIGKSGGRPSKCDKIFKCRGIMLRDKLKMYIIDHYMHQSRKAQWYKGSNNHIVKDS